MKGGIGLVERGWKMTDHTERCMSKGGRCEEESGLRFSDQTIVIWAEGGRVRVEFSLYLPNLTLDTISHRTSIESAALYVDGISRKHASTTSARPRTNLISEITSATSDPCNKSMAPQAF